MFTEVHSAFSEFLYVSFIYIKCIYWLRFFIIIIYFYFFYIGKWQGCSHFGLFLSYVALHSQHAKPKKRRPCCLEWFLMVGYFVIPLNNYHWNTAWTNCLSLLSYNDLKSDFNSSSLHSWSLSESVYSLIGKYEPVCYMPFTLDVTCFMYLNFEGFSMIDLNN